MMVEGKGLAGKDVGISPGRISCFVYWRLWKVDSVCSEVLKVPEVMCCLLLCYSGDWKVGSVCPDVLDVLEVLEVMSCVPLYEQEAQFRCFQISIVAVSHYSPPSCGLFIAAMVK